MRRIRGAYGECAKSGDRVPLDQLVPDGQFKGLLVTEEFYEPRHPQELAIELSPERHTMPAPEISKPSNEGVAAPAMTFNAQGKLIFV